MLNFLNRRINEQVAALTAELQATRSEISNLNDELSEMRFRLQEATIPVQKESASGLFQIESNGMMTPTNYLTRIWGTRPTRPQMAKFARFTLKFSETHHMHFSYNSTGVARTYDVSTLDRAYAEWVKEA